MPLCGELSEDDEEREQGRVVLAEEAEEEEAMVTTLAFSLGLASAVLPGVREGPEGVTGKGPKRLLKAAAAAAA